MRADRLIRPSARRADTGQLTPTPPGVPPASLLCPPGRGACSRGNEALCNRRQASFSCTLQPVVGGSRSSEAEVILSDWRRCSHHVMTPAPVVNRWHASMARTMI